MSRINDLEFKAIIVGDGPYLLKLKQKVENYGLDNKVIFTGAIEHREIVEFFKTVNLFVSINHLGMFGNNLLEAAKMRLPSIILNHGYITTSLKNNFILINKVNLIEELSCNLRKCMNDDSACYEYSQLSKKFSKSLSSWEGRISSEMSIIDNFIHHYSN